jgi:hypothetical protein
VNLRQPSGSSRTRVAAFVVFVSLSLVFKWWLGNRNYSRLKLNVRGMLKCFGPLPFRSRVELLVLLYAWEDVIMSGFTLWGFDGSTYVRTI